MKAVFFVGLALRAFNILFEKLNMVEIVIIGAGASGLAAASRLFERGINPAQITILEAENRIGGRVHTIQHGIEIKTLEDI